MTMSKDRSAPAQRENGEEGHHRVSPTLTKIGKAKQRLASMETTGPRNVQRLPELPRAVRPETGRVPEAAAAQRVSTLDNRLDALAQSLAQRDVWITRLEATVARLAERSKAHDDELLRRDERLAALADALAEFSLKFGERYVRAAATERDLAIQSERLTAAEQWIILRSTGESAAFPPSLDLLARLSRKDIAVDTGAAVFVSASSPTGHFLFGPYLSIEPGVFTLEIHWRAGAIKDRNAPVLTVEISAEPRLIGRQSLVANALEAPTRIAFEVRAEDRDRDAKIEFRFSHHGNADIEITAVRLHAVSGIAPKRIGRRGAIRRWWSRWLMPRR